MELKPLKSFQSKDYELSKTQGFIKEYSEQFSANPFIRGTLLEISITTSGKSVDHKLGIIPSGWFVTDKDANAVIWRTSWDDKTISLGSSASANIKIWVF